MNGKLRILHLEDDLKDAELAREMLVSEGIACDILRVDTQAAFLNALEQSSFELIFADYSLPSFDGISALKIANEKSPDTPFIFITGKMGEDLAIETLKHGATDYILKDNLSRLVPAVNRALQELREKMERKRAQKEMQIRADQQTVITQLGQRALAGCDLDELFHEAVKQITQAVNVEYCKVLELLPGEKELLLRAGVGWKEGLVGHATVGTGIDSQAGYTLLSDKPVIVENLRTEKRFAGPPLLHEHGVVSGMSVIIQGQDRPFGVLGAHTTKRLKFTEDDVHFLQAVANVLAITIERKRAEEELKESEKKLRYLSSELLTAQEKERKRIANELHDSIAASLSAIKFSIEKILDQMERDEQAQEGLRDIISRVQQVNEETRRIMADLRPSLLDDLGIVPAINWFCREYEKTYSHIRVEKQIDLSENDLSDSLKTAIYRVSQEAMNNIAKHSKASLVSLSLQEGNNGIELTIQDNGQGFDLDTVRRGLGLTTMRERTELSGGTCTIKSVKGAGTTIRCSWPFGKE